jgi:hypothetical protein
MEEAATPFPREETTPPVTKIYFGAILSWPRLAVLPDAPGLSDLRRSDVHIIMVAKWRGVNPTRVVHRIKKFIVSIIYRVRLGRAEQMRNELYERAAYDGARRQQLFLS